MYNTIGLPYKTHIIAEPGVQFFNFSVCSQIGYLVFFVTEWLELQSKTQQKHLDDINIQCYHITNCNEIIKVILSKIRKFRKKKVNADEKKSLCWDFKSIFNLWELFVARTVDVNGYKIEYEKCIRELQNSP